MQPQPLPLFGASAKPQRRGLAGFDYHDKLRWLAPVPPSHALSGVLIGFTQRCTLLVIRTADNCIITLKPERVINTSRLNPEGAKVS